MGNREQLITQMTLQGSSATVAFARIFSSFLENFDVVFLKGDLGAGKTFFARSLIQNFLGFVRVPSPTYTFMQRYQTPRFDIFHFDLYRISDSEEVLELGFEEACSSGVCLIEWPERLGDHQPAEFVVLHFSAQCIHENHRELSISGTPCWMSRLGTVGS